MRRSLPALLIAAVAPGAAGAAVLSATFSFTVTDTNEIDPSIGPVVGDVLDGTFSFDTEATETILRGFRTGMLVIDPFGTTTMGATDFDDGVSIGDTACCADRVSFTGIIPSWGSGMGLWLIDEEGEVLSGTGLPTAFDFTLIDRATLTVGLFEGQAGLTATYTRPEIPNGNGPDMPVIPLPAGLPLLAGGLGMLGMVRRG